MQQFKMPCVIIMQPIIDSTNILMLITLKLISHVRHLDYHDSENEVTESHTYINYVWTVVGYLQSNILFVST